MRAETIREKREGGDLPEVLVIRRLPAVGEVVGVGRRPAVRLGEVVARVTIVVAAQPTGLVRVGAGGREGERGRGRERERLDRIEMNRALSE